MTPDQIDALKELLNKASKHRRKSQRQKHHRMKNKRQSKKRIHRMSEREDRSRLLKSCRYCALSHYKRDNAGKSALKILRRTRTNLCKAGNKFFQYEQI